MDHLLVGPRHLISASSKKQVLSHVLHLPSLHNFSAASTRPHPEIPAADAGYQRFCLSNCPVPSNVVQHQHHILLLSVYPRCWLLINHTHTHTPPCCVGTACVASRCQYPFSQGRSISTDDAIWCFRQIFLRNLNKFSP